MRYAQIIARRDPLRLVSAAPDDFTPGAWGAPPADFGGDAIVPYCFDFAKGARLYVRIGDRRAAAQAPFHYMHLRAAATGLVAVPWRHGRLNGGEPPDARFVFSIGRCGSTLLVEALRAGGASALSEPDFPTQAVYALSGIAAGPNQQTLASLLHVMMQDVLAALDAPNGMPAIVKLRSECNAAPGLIVARQTTSPTLFMLRRFETWATSMLSLGNAAPQRLGARYARGLAALDWLVGNTDCHVLRYEDLMDDPHDTLAGAAAHLGVPFDASRIGDALVRDAQDGTPFARAVPRRKVAPQDLHAALSGWSEHKPQALLRRLGLADYC